MIADKRSGNHAVVIGGSMAGLMVARVLSDHFTRVTLLERDHINDAPEPRKGQPQARHLHVLLSAGLNTITHYFPDLTEGLREHGAIFDDLGAILRWYIAGGYRIQFKSGMTAVMMSRPLLEWQIRKRVLALPNVELRDECSVVRLLSSGTPVQVTGVEIDNRAQSGQREMLSADLVVDATGRGSASPKWLAELGYTPPQESEVKIAVGYATRVYRRKPGDMAEVQPTIIAAQPPHGTRGAVMLPIEGDRWMVGLGCWSGDYPPTDEQGFMEFARSLPTLDIYNVINRLEPISDILPYRYPSSLRRHYEKLTSFPLGFLVAGDAICSFNPVYGQGMSSAAMQAAALERILSEPSAQQNNHAALAKTFFKEASKVIDTPWQLAVGEDFRFPATTGPKAPGTDLINRYVMRLHHATHTDAVVYEAFIQVLNLLKPPTTLFHPKIVWRVLRSKSSSQQQILAPLPA